MAYSDEVRTKIEAELKLGKPPKELAEKYGVSYGTILGWRKKLDAAKFDADVDAVVEVDPHVLHTVAEEVKSKAPEVLKKEVDKLVNSVTSLERLNQKMHELAFKALEHVEAKLCEDISTKELQVLSGIIRDLYTSFNSKNVTNVNVLNSTTISTEKREIFKSSLKA